MAESPKVALKNLPSKTNWVERFHALPKGSWIRRAAERMKGKGLPEKLAIPFAVEAAERICASGDTNLPGLQQVNPKSRAEACAALAVWKKAAAKAKASDLTTRGEVRAIDLAGAFIAYSEGWSDHLPTGATSAYLDLSAETGETVDLAKAKFIQKAIKRPGQLHRDLGIPEDKPIPVEKIRVALKHRDPKVRARARLALRLRAMAKGGK